MTYSDARLKLPKTPFPRTLRSGGQDSIHTTELLSRAKKHETKHHVTESFLEDSMFSTVTQKETKLEGELEAELKLLLHSAYHFRTKIRNLTFN
jgi:hypothetical protein